MLRLGLHAANIPQATSSTYNATLVESMVRYFDVGLPILLWYTVHAH